MVLEEYPERYFEQLDVEVPRVDENMGSVVVVDGLPVAKASKQSKMTDALSRKLGKLGAVKEGSVYVPLDAEQKNMVGYAFVEFESEKVARNVVSSRHFKFDGSHVATLSHWDDFERVLQYDEEYIEPKTGAYESAGDMHWWLADDLCRDQFVMRYHGETEIYWHDPLRGGKTMENAGKEHKIDGNHWTDDRVQWSPKGSYLATFHEQGVALWAGKEFKRVGRLAHPGVKLLDFSPDERFAVTFNTVASDSDALIVWDVVRNARLRSFPFPETVRRGVWPILKWKHDSTKVAMQSRIGIQVYDLPDMTMSEGAPYKVDGLVEFEWSPNHDLIAYWTPEDENRPATVSLLSTATGTIVREKHLFRIDSLRLHWHPTGEFLCVSVVKVTSSVKAKIKVTAADLHIFKVQDKDIPVETLDLQENVFAFAWEPKGKRFAVISGIADSHDVYIYAVKKTSLKLENTLLDRPANGLVWSPLGDVLAVVGIRGIYNGQIELYSANRGYSIVRDEHFQANDVAWDPEGRYLCTAATQPLKDPEAWKYAMNNGFRIWDICGMTVWEEKLDNLYQFLWRPRPASLLGPEEKAQIRKTLRDKYYKKFDEMDEEARLMHSSAETRRMVEAMRSFREYRAKCKELIQQQTERRREIRGGLASDDEEEWDLFDEVVEDEISTVTEVIEE